MNNRKLARLRSIAPMVRTLDISAARVPPHKADAELTTPEHRAWRQAVLERARFCCEKCGRFSCRLFADHIIERKDGGALYDPANGQCLCGSCHKLKTDLARAERFAR